MSDKYEDREIKVEGRFYKWFDNFWYHNKWKTIAALFVTFVLSVCIIQSCTREKPDVAVMYAGDYLYSGSETVTVKQELASVLPMDYNRDGEKVVGLVSYHVMTEEQLKKYQEELQADSNEDGVYERVDTSYFTNQKQLCDSYLMTGECAILLVDESIYKRLAAEEGRLRKLSEVFATVPDSAFSEYGIRFSETALYKNAEQLGKLPESTVLCLLSPYVIGNTSNKTAYSAMVDTFVAMGRD